MAVGIHSQQLHGVPCVLFVRCGLGRAGHIAGKALLRVAVTGQDADGTVHLCKEPLAVGGGITGLGQGRIHGGIQLFAVLVPHCRNRFLRDGAAHQLCIHLGLQGRNDLLCFQHGTAAGAVAALGQAFLGLGGVCCFIDHRDVAQLFVGDLVIGADPAALGALQLFLAVLGAGGGAGGDIVVIVAGAGEVQHILVDGGGQLGVVLVQLFVHHILCKTAHKTADELRQLDAGQGIGDLILQMVADQVCGLGTDALHLLRDHRAELEQIGAGLRQQCFVVLACIDTRNGVIDGVEEHLPHLVDGVPAHLAVHQFVQGVLQLVHQLVDKGILAVFVLDFIHRKVYHVIQQAGG